MGLVWLCLGGDGKPVQTDFLLQVVLVFFPFFFLCGTVNILEQVMFNALLVVI